jgi:simple sugar transport system ATP-binding protein
MEEEAVLRLEKIEKSFGKVRALKEVSTTIRLGEIVALLGDNGAGKTTLVKVISGVLSPERGTIYFQGRPVHFSSPVDARALGIDTVEQNLSLINIMSISRNFFLGRELVKKVGPVTVIDKRKMDLECKRAIEDIGVQVRTPEDLVSTLSGGERQAIAIGRAFYFGCRVLLLDEPLAALSVKEARKVHDMIVHIRAQGAGVVYITHNVYHVFPIADRFVLLDKGRKLAEFGRDMLSAEEIMEAIASGQMPPGKAGSSSWA